MSGGGSQNTNTVQKSDPWSGQQPYLTDVMQKAQQNYNSNNPQYYPGSTVAGFTPMQQQAMQLTAQRAMNGSPVTQSAQNYMTNLESGNFLNSNPYLDGMYNNAADSVVRNYQNAVQPGIQSAFEGAGRYGSGGMGNALSQSQQDLGHTLSGMASQIYGNNYSNVMDQMTRGTMFAPTLANQDYTDLGQLGAVGNAQQGMNQAQLSDQVNRWNFNQNLPAQKLAQYGQMISGNYGGTSQTQSPYFTNPLAQGLGLGLGGMGLYNAGTQAGLWGGAGAGMGALMPEITSFTPIAADAAGSAAAAAAAGISDLAPLAFF